MELHGWLVKHVTYPFWLIYDGQLGALESLRDLRKSQFYSPTKLEDLRRDRLRRLLQHAFANCPYYRRIFNEAGWTLSSFKDFSDLRKLPILTKEILVNHLEELVAENIRRDKIHRTASGGSTGRQTPFYRDNACLGVKWAAEWRFHQWAGWDLGEPLALAWPARQDLESRPNWKSKLRNGTSRRELVLYAGSLSEESMERFAIDLSRQRIRHLKGFTNAVYRFAQFCRGRYEFPFLRSIVCTGEAVLPGPRSYIEEGMGAKVFDYYCGREVGPIAAQCELRTGLHLNEENLHVEFEREETASPDGTASLLITDLMNFGMPFIRYRVGDRGRPLSGQCPCGRGLRKLDQVIGRVTDFLVSTRGELVHGATLVHYALALGYDVAQVQFVQRELGRVTLRLTQSCKGRDLELAHLENTLRALLGSDVKIEREFVSAILPESSGKYRVTICEVFPPARAAMPHTAVDRGRTVEAKPQ
jgi:phenylacetate-CoA ligase